MRQLIPNSYTWLQTLIDTSFASRLLVGNDKKIVFANTAAESLFGYSSKEFVGKSIDVVFSDRAIQLIQSAMGQSVMILSADDSEIKGITKHGTELNLRIGISPFQTPDGRFFAITIFDVTEYKRIERELRFRGKQLEEINERLSRFAYMASHDLHEPLRKIITFSTLMKDAVAEGDMKTALYAGDVLHGSAMRSRGLIDGLLSYCSDMSTILNLEYFDVKAEIEQIEGEFSELVKETGAHIKNKIQPDLKLKADRMQFCRMMYSFILNSIKFRKADKKPQIIVSALKRKDKIRLSVDDNGIGFEPMYAKTIFEPFRKLHPFAQFPGHGIGLAAVKSICDRHGWSVQAESKPGRGASFWVCIPLDETHPGALAT